MVLSNLILVIQLEYLAGKTKGALKILHRHKSVRSWRKINNIKYTSVSVCTPNWNRRQGMCNICHRYMWVLKILWYYYYYYYYLLLQYKDFTRVILLKSSKHWLKPFIQMTYSVDDGIFRPISVQIRIYFCCRFSMVFKAKNWNSMADNMTNTTPSSANLPNTFTFILLLLFRYYYNYLNTTGNITGVYKKLL